MFDQVLAWIGANIELTGVLLAIAGMVGGAIAWAVRLFQKKSDPFNVTPSVTVEQHPTAINIDTDTIPVGASGKITLTLEAYESRIQDARDEVLAQIPDASGEQLQLLNRKREEYEKRLSDIEPAFEQARARIIQLEAIIEREGNLLGAEDLEEADEALANGDFDAAEQLLIRIEDQGDPEVKRTARAAYGRGQIAEEQVRWLDAADHYAKAARHDPTYDNLQKAGEFFWRAGRYEEALRSGQDLLTLSKREHGEESPETAMALNDLAIWYEKLGQYDQAETLFRQTIEIDKATIEEMHPGYAAHLNNLANLLRSMGRYEEAEPLFWRVLEIDKATIGETDPDYAIHLNNLAVLLQKMGRFDESEPLLIQAIEIDKATIGEKHPGYAIRLNNLAGLIEKMGRYKEAEPLYRQAIEIGKATIGETHPDSAIWLNNLALLLRTMGRLDEALGTFGEALAIFRKTLGPDHPNTRAGAANYAILLREYSPDDPVLAELEATFGSDIGR